MKGTTFYKQAELLLEVLTGKSHMAGRYRSGTITASLTV